MSLRSYEETGFHIPLPLEWDRGRERVVMGLEFSVLPVSPDTAETSLGKDFMLCFHSSLPNCIGGKMPPKPNKCEVN